MATEPPKASLDVGRVLGRGFGALKANFIPFLLVALLLVGLPSFLAQYLPFARLDPDHPEFVLTADFWGALLVPLLAGVLGNALLQGVLVRSTILTLSGREPDLGGSAMLALRLLLPIVGLSICVGFLIVGGFILLIVPGIMAYCAFIVAVPALVEEREGVSASMGRSRDLTRGSRWQVFLLGVLFWIFSTILAALAGIVAGANPWGSALAPDPIVAGLSSGIATSLTGLISTVVTAALYVELREVKEGTSTNELAQVFA
jgi:hypothetical protein